MRRAHALLLTLACALNAAPPAMAQASRPVPAKTAVQEKKAALAKKNAAAKKREAHKKTEMPTEAPKAEASRPYDSQLARLAEMMGALAFLRDLCRAGDGDDWRDKMTALLDADAPAGVRRQKLIGAFNSGFRGFELTYRSCTPNAEAAVARYLVEADRITADIASRYGAQ